MSRKSIAAMLISINAHQLMPHGVTLIAMLMARDPSSMLLCIAISCNAACQYNQDKKILSPIQAQLLYILRYQILVLVLVLQWTIGNMYRLFVVHGQGMVEAL